MASQAQKIEAAIKAEEAKSQPDQDVLYTLKVMLPQANVIDTDRMSNANERVKKTLESTGL